MGKKISELVSIPEKLHDEDLILVQNDASTYKANLNDLSAYIKPHYYPSMNTASLYVEVTPEYNDAGEEMGTIENPIPYDGNMILEEGKYYSQDGVTYLCNSGNPVYHALKDLVGLYVEVV